MMEQHEQAGFRALADPTRRNILQLLTNNEMTIADVAGNFEMTRAAVKKHLIILDTGNLISVQACGRSRMNALNPGGLKILFDWFSYFDAFWDDRLTTLKTEIEKDKQ
jgi:DNA-binding transcriptional ArsR family regulator